MSSATADIGTGTYTIMTQIAAETLGLPLASVTFELGDSRLPKAPIEGGSWTAASVGSAVKAVRRAGVDRIEEEATAEPSKTHEEYALSTHSAVFAKVRVDEALGTVRVSRVVSAIAGGRVLNPKTARSQVLGSIVGGIGMALEEESVLDHALGRFMTHNLADYHFPVHADVHDIDVIFVEERDDIVTAFHATGKRVRDLPITLDKLL